MSDRLAGKTAVVTAAGQGIGLAIAEMFAAQGAKVIATDVNQQALDAIDTPGITIDAVNDMRGFNTSGRHHRRI